MARNYNPEGGISYWGRFEDKFPKIEEILKQEFGLVQAWGPNKACLVAEENGRGLWHVHFKPFFAVRKSSEQQGLDIISFEYWHNRAKEEDFQRDPMRKSAERVYRLLQPDIQLVTTSGLDIPVDVPWI